MPVLFIGVSLVLLSRDGRYRSPTEKCSEKTTESGVVAIHDFAHSCAQRTGTGQGAVRLLVPVRLYRPMKSTGLSDRHLCTQTGDDFESGEFHVCPDESQFSVS